MSLFTWDDKYRVGNAEIDTQHRELFRLSAELHDAMSTGSGKAILNTTLDRLIRYTQYHFSQEQALMRNSGFPDFVNHKLEHDKLIREVLDLQRKLAAGSITVTIETMEFLRNWLEHHILGSDQKIANHLRERDRSNSSLAAVLQKR